MQPNFETRKLHLTDEEYDILAVHPSVERTMPFEAVTGLLGIAQQVHGRNPDSVVLKQFVEDIAPVYLKELVESGSTDLSFPSLD